MQRESYPTAIIHCPDCGVECNFVANCLAEMPFSYPGTYHPHQKGSRECLERQVRNLKTKIARTVRMLAIEKFDEQENEGRRPHPEAFHYQLYWKMRHSSVVRTVTSGTLKDLALVYHGLIARQVAVKTLELRVWDRITELYKSIPFPVNWKEVIKDATYGKAKHLKCPICGNVDLIEENVLGRCELCYAHGGSAPQMEPFEVENDATRISATGSQVCTS